MADEREFTSASFYKYLAERKLMASRCKQCGSLHLPPKPLCSDCGSNEMAWAELKGRGKLAAFTAISVGPSFMQKKGHDRNNPYTAGIVVLEEGPRISARILGGNAKEPEKIEIGAPAEIDFTDDGGESGKPILAFKV